MPNAVIDTTTRPRQRWMDMAEDETGSGRPYKVVPLRATGVAPEAVALQMEEAINDAYLDGLLLDRVEPIVFNSSTTGYLLLVFAKSTIGVG